MRDLLSPPTEATVDFPGDGLYVSPWRDVVPLPTHKPGPGTGP